jgi:hypothetical protein
MILTDAHARPIPRPERSEYPAGIDGFVAYMRAYAAYRDHVASIANEAFAKTFRSALRA